MKNKRGYLISMTRTELFNVMARNRWGIVAASRELKCCRNNLVAALEKKDIRDPSAKIKLTKEVLRELMEKNGGLIDSVAAATKYDRSWIWKLVKRWELEATITIPKYHQLRKTHCPSGHEYNEKNTHINTRGGRICRTCGSWNARKYRKREREKHGQSSGQRIRHESSTENMHNLLGSTHDSGAVQVRRSSQDDSHAQT